MFYNVGKMGVQEIKYRPEQDGLVIIFDGTSDKNTSQETGYDKRRRILAEERTGQIVIKAPGMGYIALSHFFEVCPKPELASIALDIEHEAGLDQLELL